MAAITPVERDARAHFGDSFEVYGQHRPDLIARRNTLVPGQQATSTRFLGDPDRRTCSDPTCGNKSMTKTAWRRHNNERHIKLPANALFCFVAGCQSEPIFRGDGALRDHLWEAHGDLRGQENLRSSTNVAFLKRGEKRAILQFLSENRTFIQDLITKNNALETYLDQVFVGESDIPRPAPINLNLPVGYVVGEQDVDVLALMSKENIGEELAYENDVKTQLDGKECWKLEYITREIIKEIQ